ncbi:hypothetical protein AZI86_15895 [Bdellovibrio bacteriovorus]|uniref:Uncharacterized protein n=1 Tax=Bdellovibrio bacteriovorus TaxID=959 RepID=A0A150WHU7_BDEBC|nr:hypothetical protein [Bdellovibrio bacteriovorus]KYG63184.1 hypothetical protein AZI86_15895 [Bdellovibrio bacteriovorus]
MKMMLFTMASILTFSAHASELSSRTRYSCGFDSRNKYEIEIAIDDVGDEDGTITLINKKTNEIVRTSKAYYKNEEFLFGTDFKESIRIGPDSSFGTYDVIWGFVSMKEAAGSIHCTEIMY